jgi:2'-5' RNA ligase
MIHYTLALLLPSSIQNQLASQLCYGLQSALWTETDSLHVNLRHLGPLTSSELFEVKESLRDLYFNPFQLQLAGIRYLPQTRKHGSLLLEVTINEKILQLKKETDKALKNLKLPTNTLAPNVNLGSCQVQDVGDYLFNHAHFHSPLIEITGCSLFSIHTSQKKIFYEEVAHYPSSPPTTGAD